MTHPIVDHIQRFPINSIFDIEMLLNTIAVNYSNIPSMPSTMRFVFDKLAAEKRTHILNSPNNLVFRSFSTSEYRKMFKGLRSVKTDGGYTAYFNDAFDADLIEFLHYAVPEFSAYNLDNYLQDGDGSDDAKRLLQLFYHDTFREDLCMLACSSKTFLTEYYTFFSNNYDWFIEQALASTDLEESTRASFVGIESMRWLAGTRPNDLKNAKTNVHFQALVDAFKRLAAQLNPELYKVYTILDSMDALGANPVQTLLLQHKTSAATETPLPTLG